MLALMMQSHGQVEAIHNLRLAWRQIFQCRDGIRQALRKALWRLESGKIYQSVNTEADNDDDFNSDPRYFCHYIQFVGSHKADLDVQTNLYDSWIRTAVKLLGDQAAASLLSPVGEDDTERSIMVKPPRSARRCSVPAFWESLS